VINVLHRQNTFPRKSAFGRTSFTLSFQAPDSPIKRLPQHLPHESWEEPGTPALKRFGGLDVNPAIQAFELPKVECSYSKGLPGPANSHAWGNFLQSRDNSGSTRFPAEGRSRLAKTVNGPAPLSVSTSPAASSALASVWKEPAATAVSTMSFFSGAATQA
jgi:hypothetical protein